MCRESLVDGQEVHKVKAPRPGKHDLKSWWRIYIYIYKYTERWLNFFDPVLEKYLKKDNFSGKIKVKDMHEVTIFH